MAVKQFPQDYQAGAATKLLGATADGSLVYIVVPAGGDTLESILTRGNQSNKDLNVENIITNAAIAFKGKEIDINHTSQGLNFRQFGFQDALVFIQKNTGYVGFSTPNPTQKVHVVGNILASGSITPGSDKRLKKKIKSLPSSLDAINQLRPVSYTLKEDDATALGFIADEVREIFPDLVLEGKDEEKMLAMNYMGLTAPIVKAVQELSAQVSQLQERIAVLESK